MTICGTTDYENFCDRSWITKKSIGRNSDGFFCIVDGGVTYLSCPREDLRIIDLPGTR